MQETITIAAGDTQETMVFARDEETNICRWLWFLQGGKQIQNLMLKKKFANSFAIKKNLLSPTREKTFAKWDLASSKAIVIINPYKDLWIDNHIYIYISYHVITRLFCVFTSESPLAPWYSPAAPARLVALQLPASDGSRLMTSQPIETNPRGVVDAQSLADCLPFLPGCPNRGREETWNHAQQLLTIKQNHVGSWIRTKPLLRFFSAWEKCFKTNRASQK